MASNPAQSNYKSRSWVFNFFGAGIIWGSSFYFMIFANQSLPPIGVAFWRCFFGALTLFIIIKIRKMPLKFDKRLITFAFIVGAINNAIPFTLFAYGEHHVSSAFAGMTNAFTPIATVLALLTVFRSEKVTRNQLIGLFVGTIGVLILVGVWEGVSSDSLPAVIAVILAPTLYGFGGPFIKKFIEPMNQPPEVAAFWQILGATVIMVPFYLTQPLFTGPITAASLGSTLMLGIFGTAIAYTLYYPLLKQVGSAVSSAVTFLIPLVAVTLGVLALGEQLKWYEPVGGVAILLGAAIAQGLFRSRKKLAM
ncbi:MAG: DMT family transporter [Microbacteriaceae bacterium]|nr:DMT family transporter [Microbacteriaceae bacterium]